MKVTETLAPVLRVCGMRPPPPSEAGVPAPASPPSDLGPLLLCWALTSQDLYLLHGVTPRPRDDRAVPGGLPHTPWTAKNTWSTPLPGRLEGGRTQRSPEEEGTGALAQHIVGEHIPKLPGHVAHEPQHRVAPLGGRRSEAISRGALGPPHPPPPQGPPPASALPLPTFLLLCTWGFSSSTLLLSSDPPPSAQNVLGAGALT